VSATSAPESRLAHMPISMFAIVMGLAGFTIVYEKAEHLKLWLFPLSPVLLLLTVAAFIAVTTAYAIKYLRFPEHVLREFNHPVKLSFFPAISICLILLGIAGKAYAPELARAAWALGTAAHLVFTLHVLTAWMHHDRFEILHSNPAWFIPVVGNILVPVAGTEFASPEISWFFFSIGLLFWLVFLTILMNRIIFHNPLPEKLLPTLFILIAPPAVGMIAWMQLNGGELDAFARILYYAGLFTTLLLLFQFTHFVKVKFFLSWWAYSFPTAAITIATMLMVEHTQAPVFTALAYSLMLLHTLVIGLLAAKTIPAMLNGSVFEPD